MRKIFSILLMTTIALAAQATQADTIHLKNGSVLKGKVASFADDLFVIMLDTGSGQYMSKAMIYMGDVARIEFDSAPSITSGTEGPSSPSSSSGSSEFSDSPPARIDAAPARQDNSSSILPSVSKPREEISRDSSPGVTVLRDEVPRDTQPAEAVRDATEAPAEAPKTDTDTPQPQPVTESPAPARPSRKLTGPVRTASIDVVAARDWTSTGLIVKRGDVLRITATGSVVLDPVSGKSSGPEGTEAADAKKLLQDRPTGALIGVIGADNDDFIYIGNSAEFTATRDGLLFLSVNEGTLSDNEGSYKATIELQAQRASIK